ncbi:MAG: hypothetical protein MZU79_01150 [Anaerotruncus sp.]|nr:hypothetical protein [Anaerotruncus sp.]
MVFAVFFAVLGIAPVYRDVWVAEVIPVVIVFALLRGHLQGFPLQQPGLFADGLLALLAHGRRPLYLCSRTLRLGHRPVRLRAQPLRPHRPLLRRFLRLSAGRVGHAQALVRAGPGELSRSVFHHEHCLWLRDRRMVVRRGGRRRGGDRVSRLPGGCLGCAEGHARRHLGALAAITLGAVVDSVCSRLFNLSNT